MDAAALVTPYNHISFKRRKNTWYTIASGNWSDPNIWMSNSHRRYSSPQTGDDVSIGLGHTVTCNASASLNNLYVTGSLVFDSTARTVTLAGDIQATGSVNMSNAAHNLVLSGVNNFIATFTSGTTATVTYGRIGDQQIMDLAYRNLSITNIGTKYATQNIVTAGSFVTSTSCVVELSTYNLSVNGTSSINSSSSLSKTGSGSILFVGAVSTGIPCTINLSGNPTVECRGGISLNGVALTSGTGIWSVTTNSQSITTFNGTHQINTVLISGAITLTNAVGNTNGVLQINNSIDGTIAGSAFVNKANLYFNNASGTAMATAGTFDKDNFSTNVIGYVYNGDITLPYTTYQGVVITGTGTKTLRANTTISTVLTVATGAFMELSGFDLSIGSTSSISGTLSKIASGNILFSGLVSVLNGTISFSGNPSVELRGGITLTNAPNISSGSGTWSFTTNNQAIDHLGINPATFTFVSPILISGAITLSTTATAGTPTYLFASAINGNNAASTFDNRGTVQYQATQAPMLTGVLQTNAAANTFIYNAAGNQDVKGGASTAAKQVYRTLTLAGTGNKVLQGYISVVNTFTITVPAVKVDNGFTATNP